MTVKAIGGSSSQAQFINNGTLSPNGRVPNGYQYFVTSFVTRGLYISESQTFVVSFPRSGVLTRRSAMGMAKDNENVRRNTPGFGPGWVTTPVSTSGR